MGVLYGPMNLAEPGARLLDQGAQAGLSREGRRPRGPDPLRRPPRRATRQKKTMQLSRALSDLVKYTKSVGTHDVDTEGEGRPGPWAS